MDRPEREAASGAPARAARGAEAAHYSPGYSSRKRLSFGTLPVLRPCSLRSPNRGACYAVAARLADEHRLRSELGDSEFGIGRERGDGGEEKSGGGERGSSHAPILSRRLDFWVNSPMRLGTLGPAPERETRRPANAAATTKAQRPGRRGAVDEPGVERTRRRRRSRRRAAGRTEQAQQQPAARVGRRRSALDLARGSSAPSRSPRSAASASARHEHADERRAPMPGPPPQRARGRGGGRRTPRAPTRARAARGAGSSAAASANSRQPREIAAAHRRRPAPPRRAGFADANSAAAPIASGAHHVHTVHARAEPSRQPSGAAPATTRPANAATSQPRPGRQAPEGWEKRRGRSRRCASASAGRPAGRRASPGAGRRRPAARRAAGRAQREALLSPDAGRGSGQASHG